jgi:alpha-amylase
MRKILPLLVIFALFASSQLPGRDKPQPNKLFFSPKSDVFMQGFYWDSPPGGIWWDSLAQLAPRLASAGFSAIWYPSPVKGAAGTFSMGYDPYDHYDFGEYNQKGTTATRFGTRSSLVNSIDAFHSVGINVYADAVMLFANGGDEKVPYLCKPSPSYPDSEWLLFNYPYGSGRFPKSAASFYPNSLHCDVTPPYHGPTDPAYQFGQWFDKDPGPTRDSLVVWGQYLKNVIGFDGFRLDAVKSIDPVFMGYWLSHVNSGGYAVAEDWASTGEISGWLNTALANGGGSLAMFDFDLRFALQSMCNSTDGSYNMTWLDGTGLVHNGVSGYNVATFVENHDMDRIGWDGNIDGSGHNPIISDKILAYAYTIFSEGRPCVFFKDYFMYGLGRKIDTLIWIRQNFLGGGTTQRSGLNAYYIREDASTDQTANAADIYVARRDGYLSQPGGYIVINDNATKWMDVWVDTELPVGSVLKDYTGRDGNKVVTTPDHPGGKNRVKLWAPKRSYTIYVADTTKTINHPPVLQAIPDQMTYTNAHFSYQTFTSDADNNNVSYYLTNSPAWLSVSDSGLLTGTPAFGDTGTTNVIVTVDDNHGGTASDTFAIQVRYNRRPVLSHINDTTINVTKRYQYDEGFNDPDGDTLTFGFIQAPLWLNIGLHTGIVSGTPDIGDVGVYAIKISAADGKGGEDSTAYTLTVSASHDSVIATYGKPKIDGTIDTTGSDWAPGWLISADPPNDSKWWKDSVHVDNELYGLYATWDADSLYLGFNYFLTDSNNTLMVYIDAGIGGGQLNFNSHQGYSGAYPKNNRFRSIDGIDYFIADYRYDKPHLFKTFIGSAINLDSVLHGVRGAGGHDAEVAIAWNDIYGLGAGLVPPHVNLKLVGVIAGGDNWGSGDACPDNPDINGDSGPDSLINLVSIMPDTNSDGIPDPTRYIDTVITPVTTVSKQNVYSAGWDIVSIPLKMSDYRKAVLFPHAATSAFYYDFGYHTVDTLRNNFGYWLKFNSADTVTYLGLDRTLDTITVKKGWNIVGSIAYPVATGSIIQEPSDIINSSFYYFDGLYKQAITLQPGIGYWVKASANGKLILSK